MAALKNLLLPAMTLIILASSPLHALQFSSYACNFERVDGGDWQPSIFFAAMYVSELGQNQTTPGQKFTWGDSGVCSTISSTDPANLSLNIYLVTGSNLDPFWDGCLYTGKVEASAIKADLTSNDQYLGAILNTTIDGHKVDLLAIQGARPTSKVDDLDERCLRDFKDFTKNARLSSVRATQSPARHQRVYENQWMK